MNAHDTVALFARVAQSVEHLPFKQGVGSSSLFTRTSKFWEGGNELKDVSVQEKRINDINHELKELKARQASLKDELVDSLQYCSKCNHYYDLEDLKLSFEESHVVECVFTDAGYGDDDRFANVKRAHTYYHCPLCQEVLRHTSVVVSTGKSFTRDEYRNYLEKAGDFGL